MDEQETKAKAWDRLRDELHYLKAAGVTSIHPSLLDSYMDYIKASVELEVKGKV